MSNNAPDALLVTTPGCPHCPGVHAALQALLEQGLLNTLEVIDAGAQPARAAELGVRSAPWMRIGPFILTGAQSQQQLKAWAQRAAGGEGMTEYLGHLLANGELNEAERLIRQAPEQLQALLPLIETADTPMQVRLGISSLMETHAGSPSLLRLLPVLITLSEHADHRVRADVCYYLGLSHSLEASPALQARLEDDHVEVREIAAEALAELPPTH